MQQQTFIGVFFSFHALRSKEIGESYFRTLDFTRDQALASFGAIRQQQEQTINLLHKITFAFCDPYETRYKMLKWISKTLTSNKQRAQMSFLLRPDTTTSSDGFLVNLCHVLLKLCFTEKGKQDFKKIDIGFIKNNSIGLDFSDETLLTSEENDKIPDIEYLGTITPDHDYVSSCFFLSHYSIHVGLVPVITYYEKMLQPGLLRLNQALSNLSRYPPSQQETIKNQLTQRFQVLLREKLTMDAILLDPLFTSDLLMFYSFTSSWLLKISQKKLNEFYQVPEFIIEDFIRVITFILKTEDHITKNKSTLRMQVNPSIVELLVILVGNKKLIRNPYLRSKLVESLNAIAGTEKDILNPLFLVTSQEIFRSNATAKEKLIPALIQLYIDIEQTGRNTQFYEKFAVRYNISLLLKYLRKIEEYEISIIQTSYDRNLFLFFINMLVNDTNYLLDETFAKIKIVHELEDALQSPLNQQTRMEKEQELSNLDQALQTSCLLANETIYLLNYLSTKNVGTFMESKMIDRLAEMLNYFLSNLVGSISQHFKVKDIEKYQFQPKVLLANLVEIYVNFYHQDHKFAIAIEKDARSFSITIFQQVLKIITDNNLVHQRIMEQFKTLLTALNECSSVREQTDSILEDIPNEFLDPISFTIMKDPVTLPTSSTVMDREVIERHLLSSSTDPFNRKELKPEMLTPNKELKDKIEAWVQIAKSTHMGRKMKKKVINNEDGDTEEAKERLIEGTVN